MPEINAGLNSSSGETQPDAPLRALLITLSKRRKTFVFLSLTATVFIIALAAFIYFGQVRQQVTTLKFKIDFKGVEENKYPNGMKFSTSDIISPQVLGLVYEQDNLQEYMDFADFKAAITIIQTNDKLKFLEYEYAGKLSDKKMDIQERERIEVEFREKKESALAPIYSLEFFQDTRVSSIPLELRAKILDDTLKIWARIAVQSKGASEYQIDVISPNILNKAELEDLNYFIASDLIRLTVNRIKDNISELRELPGASVIEMGEDGLKLGDLSYQMEDLERFTLNPLSGLIRRSRATKDQESVLPYLENRIFELKLKNIEAASLVDLYRDSLGRYSRKSGDIVPVAAGERADGVPFEMGTTIPQLGESFLQNVIDMAREDTESQFRQDLTRKIISAGIKKNVIASELSYYQDMYERIKDPDKSLLTEAERKSVLNRIDLKHRKICDRLLLAINQLNTFYQTLSRNNLNPDSLLYTVREPVITVTERSIDINRLLLLVILAMILAEAIIITGIWWKSILPSELDQLQ